MRFKKNFKGDCKVCIFSCLLFFSLSIEAHDARDLIPFSAQKAHAPTPLPDRVTLTWEYNPTTSQSVTWRTDTSIEKGLAQFFSISYFHFIDVYACDVSLFSL